MFMAKFWLDRPPLYVHHLASHEVFQGERFATVDEGDETTVITPATGPKANGPYACLTMGPFELSLVGVLAKASAALAGAGIPVFVISTYRYDHILVPLDRKEEAVRALMREGFERKG
jgi:hypothetical protein